MLVPQPISAVGSFPPEMFHANESPSCRKVPGKVLFKSLENKGKHRTVRRRILFSLFALLTDCLC